MFRAISLSLLLALGFSAAASAQEASPSTKEHEWLEKFVGEWTSSSEYSPGPGLPSISCKGVTKVHKLGGLWIVGESESTMGEIKVSSVITLGYDPAKKKYVGTWVDSFNNHLWKYEGEVDSTGKVITLEAEGPDFTNPGKTTLFRDVYEFKSDDHKVLSSQVKGPDGAWTTFMTMDYRKKK